jgi:hypothetical protein
MVAKWSGMFKLRRARCAEVLQCESPTGQYFYTLQPNSEFSRGNFSLVVNRVPFNPNNQPNPCRMNGSSGLGPQFTFDTFETNGTTQNCVFVGSFDFEFQQQIGITIFKPTSNNLVWRALIQLGMSMCDPAIGASTSWQLIFEAPYNPSVPCRPGDWNFIEQDSAYPKTGSLVWQISTGGLVCTVEQFSIGGFSLS